MSGMPKMEITEKDTKYGDSNIIQSPRQYLVISKTEITMSGLVQVKLEPSESDFENEIDSQISSQVKTEIDMEDVANEKEERIDSSIQCLHCTPPRIFKKMKGLKSHQIRAHGIPREPFQCDQCTTTFVKAERLDRHRMIVHVRSFTCDQCSKSFASSDSLKNHIDGVHLYSERKKKSKKEIQLLKKKLSEEKRERERERIKHLRMIAAMESEVKKMKEKASTNIDEEISSANHESNQATTSNSASTSSTFKEELPLVCFLCPQRFESDQAMNSHLTLYHRVQRSEIN